MYRLWFLILLVALTACPGFTGPGDVSGTVNIGTSAGTSAGNVGMDFVAGEVIVRFKSAPLLQSVQISQASGVVLQQVESLGVAGAALYRAKADKTQTLQMIAELEARSDVLYAHPNYLMQALATPNDARFAEQWDLAAMKLPEAWDLENGTTTPVTVAVVDTGILTEHPDFVGKIASGGYDFISNPSIAVDGDGRDANPEDVGDNPTGQSSYHGSHVAGTLAAVTNNQVGIAGISWGAKILPLRTLGKGGGTVSDIVAALRYAAGLAVMGAPQNPSKAQIINLSLGGPGQCSDVQIYQDTIDQVLAAGTLLVVAAGNENVDASKMAPANCSGVITVGATDPGTMRARYSNYGAHVDVMAPGGDVLINLNGRPQGGGILAPGRTDSSKTYDWNFKNGTSMAAPHVAGLLALMKSKKPSLSFSEAQDILGRTSQPLSQTQCRGNRSELEVEDCGNGLVNAQAALQALSAAPAADFTLSLSPDTLSSAINESVSLTVQINRTGGFANPVTLSLRGPGEISSSFSSTSVSGNNATLTLNIPNLPAKSYSLVVQGSSGPLTHSADLTVSVVSTPGGNLPTLQNTRLRACFYNTSTDHCDPSKSKDLILNTTQRSAPYQFSNLEGGYYRIEGFKDINNNGALDEGDYYGYFSNLVQPNRTGVNFSLELLQETPSQTTDPLQRPAR